MKLRAKVTVLFGAASAIVLALVVTGLPALFTRIIEEQMESHARTFAVLIGKDIGNFGFGALSNPGHLDDTAMRRRLAAELRDSAAVGMRSGGFMVESIFLVDRSGTIVVGYPEGDEGKPAPERAAVLAAIGESGEAPLREETAPILRKGGAMSVIAPIVTPSARILAVEVLLDFSKSMAMHRAEFSSDELLAIAAAILIEFAQAIVLLWFIGRSALAPAALISEAMGLVARGEFDARVSFSSADEFGDMAGRFNEMARSLKEKSLLSRYVSRATLDMVRNSADDGMSFRLPVRKIRTILFSDIRGFTSFSESRTPEFVIDTLNRLLDIQAAAILDCGGEIDKFIGDEIMASFEGARRAILCALKIQRLLGPRAEAFGGLRVGIGICEGAVVEGDVGVETRKDFTLIGDAVNTAARLESAAAPGEILVPSSILADPRMAIFVARRKGECRLKGKKYPLEVSSVTGVASAAFRASPAGAS